MTKNDLFLELEKEAEEIRELEGIDLSDLPGQDDELGETELPAELD